jgi:YihY family inner membrane protein
LIERVQRRVAQVAERVAALPPVRTFNKVMETYNSAAGGLLAAGLAYGALVALLPGFLLFAGLVGFVISDAVLREDLIERVSDALPPLAPFVRDGLLTVVGGASLSSIVGIIGLAWGTSRFYGQLDEAFARIFRTAPERDMVERIIRGLISVLLLIGGFVGAVVVAAGQQFIDSTLPGDQSGETFRTVLRVGGPLLTIVAVTLIVAAIYRWVPNVKVPLPALGRPAIAVGIVLALLTQAFVFIAPRLIGSLAVFGGVAAVFAALAWLALGFQAVLIGAAWVRERIHEDDPTAVPPTPAEAGIDPVMDVPRRVRKEPPAISMPPPPGVPPTPPPSL